MSMAPSKKISILLSENNSVFKFSNFHDSGNIYRQKTVTPHEASCQIIFVNEKKAR